MSEPYVARGPAPRTRWGARRSPPRMDGFRSREERPPARAQMTDSTPEVTTAKHTLVVPNSINMVSLLGPGDEHLGLIEKAFDADVHVRGNRITIEGEPAEIAL